MPGPIKKTHRIANRVKPDLVFTSQLRIGLELADEINQPQNAGGFVPVDPGKNPKLNAWLYYFSALKNNAWQPESFLPNPPKPQ